MKLRLKRLVCRVVGHDDEDVGGAKLCNRCLRADLSRVKSPVDWSAGS